MKPHPHDLLLEEFAATFKDDADEVLDHLITCEKCQRRLKSLLRPQPSLVAGKVGPGIRPLGETYEYDPMLEKVARSIQGLQKAYEVERGQAVALLPELLAHPFDRRMLLLRNSPRFQTWSLTQLLLRRSREQNYHDASSGEGLALLALEVLEHLDASYYGLESIEDLRARAWAYVANSRRIKADFRGAEQAFALAFASLARGTRQPMERAVLLDLRASLLRAQRRFGEALRLLRRAIVVFRQLGEQHRAGRSLLSISTVHHVAGEPEKAIPILYEALELIDPAREPRLLLVAWHNLIDDLAETGQFMEGQKLLGKARALYQRFPQPWSRNPRIWVEGKIARGLGQERDAEVLFLRARDGFLAEDAAYDTALVSLDLASLFAKQGRVKEVKRTAEEMMPIFSSRQIHREALAALVFWKQAVEAERAGIELVSGVAAFLKRARHDPDLRFEEPKS
ncbi:MAG TPA: tetratricopeptide repeat protein [Thermoanaerobaculia bacterium]|nr:tetratricopeptide repeat protein [Thermoanaerobaculia bacterium]